MAGVRPENAGEQMIKTVYDLIRALTEFDPNTPVVFRRTFEGGYYSDYSVHRPSKLFPGESVVLSAFELIPDAAVEGNSGRNTTREG